MDLAGILTLLVGLVIIYFYITIAKERKFETIPFIVLIIALAISIITSFDVLKKPISFVPFKLESLLNPWLLFFLFVLIKFLICFWMVALAVGILNPIRIIEYGADLFGIKVSNKYSEQVREIGKNTRIAEEQFNIIVKLSRNIFDRVIKPFEDYILSCPNQPEAIRQLVYDELNKSYINFPNVKIHVISLNEKGYATLDSQLASTVRLLAMEGKPIVEVVNETIGIAIIHGFEDLNAAIVIDTTRQKYEVSDAEICSASTFFVSVATAVLWASKNNITSQK